MVSSALHLATPASAGAHWRRRLSRGLLVRIALCLLAVVACYQFSWLWLRHWTLLMNAALDRLSGVVLQPVAADTVTWHGAVYRYVIACTFADVWCGAVPLLWDLCRSVRRNLVLLAAFTAGLAAFNIIRLSFSDVVFAWGVPWDLAHNVVSGVAYFVVLEFVVRFGGVGKELRNL